MNELGGLSEVGGIEGLLEVSVDMETNIAVGRDCMARWRSLLGLRMEEFVETRILAGQIAIVGDHEMIPGSESLAALLQVPTC